MADTPEAAPANGTEETPNTQPTTEQTTSNEAAAQGDAKAPVVDIPADKIEAFNSFIKGQGGFDKAFDSWKNSISKPAEQTQPDQAKTPEPQTKVEQLQQPQQTEQNNPAKMPEGYISKDEFVATQYYESLASRKEYASIADKIRSGEVFKGMRELGISPMDQSGNINDGQVRTYLNLLASSMPAKQSEAPDEAAAPTVDYIPTNSGKIESYEQAAKIIAQSQGLKDKGIAEHPDLEAAKEFIKGSFAKQSKK